MRNFFIALTLALFTPAVAFCQWLEDGAAAPELAWQKEVDGFAAMLILTRQPDRFLSVWGTAPRTAPSPDYKPEIQSTSRAARGEPVVAFVLFSGCVPNAAGVCDSTVDFTVFQPDGSEFAELKQAELWKDKAAPPVQTLQLGATSLGVVVDAEYPLGDYKIHARACDSIAGRCVDLERTLETVDPAEALDLNNFLHRYYRDPRPILVEPAMHALDAGKFLVDPSARPPMIGFFAMVFLENPDFLPHWVAVIEGLEVHTRETLKAAIALSQSPAALTSEQAPSPLRNDMLWGAFFATGDAEVVHAIVERMKHLGEREDLNLFLTASSAQWSLCSNAKAHPFVAKILQDLHASGDEWRQDIDDVLAKNPAELRRATDEVLRAQKENGVW